MDSKNIKQVRSYFLQLQEDICASLEKTDAKAKFGTDRWDRDSGGMGISRVINEGAVIEKGGVNFSHVYGKSLPGSATATRPELAGRSYQAMGVSLVIHPNNPFAPTSHANFRFFVAEKGNEEPVWWFGGGYDLTPYYGFDEDCIHWHAQAQQACQGRNENYYTRFKKNCDDYFFIKHRKEPRGIGGLFFDDFNAPGFDDSFGLVRAIGDSYLSAYQPIIERRKEIPFTEQHKQFQEYRRGRYVEFNLVYDRGTLFGLQSGVGRIESILMSLPPTVRWRYDWKPEVGSAEEKLYKRYLVPRDWINE